MKSAVAISLVLGVGFPTLASASPADPAQEETAETETAQPETPRTEPARVEPAQVAVSRLAAQTTGHRAYLSVGGETIFVDRAGDQRNSTDDRGVFLVQAGVRVWSPLYVHAALGLDGNHVSHPLEGRLGAEVRVGSKWVKAIAGVDVGYVRDFHPWRDAMENIGGVTVIPRIGCEVGNHTLWLRGMIDTRELLGTNRGRSASGGASIGHDF